MINQPTVMSSRRPWDLPPRFPVAMTSPLAGDEWTWREVSPRHPVISERPNFLRRYDLENAIGMISARYGDPTAYCVLGTNVASVMSWADITFEQQYLAVTAGAGAFPCGGMYYLDVQGPGAARALNLLTPRNIDALEVGQATFVIFTTPEGTVDTEGIVLRDGPQSFKASIGGTTRPPTWLYDALEACPDAEASEANLTSFNIKGPRRDEAMQRLLTDESAAKLDELAVFRAIPVKTRAGEDAWVLRTVIGLEMWSRPETVREAWRWMLDDPAHVTPCGWDVLASYRLECTDIAFFLCPLDIHRGTYIRDVSLSHALSPIKETPYIGRAALSEQERPEGTLRIARLAALSNGALRREIGEALYVDPSGPARGFVTTSGYSPIAGRELCFAHLTPDIGFGAVVRFADGSEWEVSPLPSQSGARSA